MHDKIGLGIVTYNRTNFLKRVLSTVPVHRLDEFVIVNDGDFFELETKAFVIHHDTNKGVGISKNDALKYLLEKGCDHIFLMEDDILMSNENVFDVYIETSKKTGIQHFNFSQHGMVNKLPRAATPAPRLVIEYADVKVSLYRYCIGAFSYYTRECIDSVGLMDERYYNACEHVDHTYRTTLKGLHPPYWWFADVFESEKLLSEITWSVQESTISSRSDHNTIVTTADKIFFDKFQTYPLLIPECSVELLKASLKTIYNNKH